MKKKSLAYPLFVWGLGASYFLIQYIVRISPSVMHPNLASAFHLSGYQFGLLASLYFWAYIIMQIPVGVLLDRYGTRLLLSSSIIIASIGAIMFASTSNIYVADTARFLMGLGSSFSFIGGIKLAKDWFEEKYFGVLAGATQGAGMFGASFGNIIIAATVIHLGWRNASWIMAALYMILGVLIFSFVRNNPKNKKLTGQQDRVGILESLTIVCKNAHTWVNAIYIGLMYAPSQAFAALWGVSYLELAYGIRREFSALIIGAFYLGWAVGAPALGWISDHIGRRKPILFASALLSIIMLGVVIYVPIFHGVWLYLLLFIYGFVNGGSTLSYAVSSELNPRRVSGTAVSLANMVSVAIGVMCQPLIGWFLDLLWHGKMIHGARHFTLGQYQTALSALMITLAIAVVLSLFIKETHCKNND